MGAASDEADESSEDAVPDEVVAAATCVDFARAGSWPEAIWM